MIFRLDYAAHEVFVAPARASRALWRFALGFVVTMIGYFAFSQVFFRALGDLTQASRPGFAAAVFDGMTPLALLILLMSFGFMTLSVWVVTRLVHDRAPLGLLGPLGQALRQGGAVLVLLTLLGLALFLLPPWDMGGALVPNLPMGLWVALLPLSLLAVFVQVSAEEIFFRGYIQQQLAARFRSPLVWMIAPSCLFALGHYLPQDAGENAVMIAVWAGLFGILMADLTARAGGLGPAIALHFYNNVTAILFVSVPDGLSGLALFHAPFSLADEAMIRAWLPVDFAHMIVAWLVARLAIRR